VKKSFFLSWMGVSFPMILLTYPKTTVIVMMSQIIIFKKLCRRLGGAGENTIYLFFWGIVWP